MFDVVCIGNALVDITVNVDDSFIVGAGLKKGSMSLVDDVSQKFLLSSIMGMRSTLSTGGSASNVALGVACLGAKSCFIGGVGVDDNGSFFEDFLISKGVIPRLNKDIKLSTGSAITLISEDGERTFSTYLGAASSLSVDDLSGFPDANFLHVEAYLLENIVVKDLIIDLVNEAKSKGVKISFDLSDASLIQRIKPVLVEFLDLVDVVFANEAEAEAFTGESGGGAARILSKVCEIAVVKLGEKGSVVVSGKNLIEVPVEVVVPVNTNGAGDAYAAGFLTGLSKNLSLSDCAELASFLARETVLVEEASVQVSLKNKLDELF
ncbi:adenosine kinase [Candidatus Woesearchaeota archaeon]|nr:adenosine kinase [Candidatus Woesearchaeota archaeon]